MPILLHLIWTILEVLRNLVLFLYLAKWIIRSRSWLQRIGWGIFAKFLSEVSVVCACIYFSYQVVPLWAWMLQQLQVFRFHMSHIHLHFPPSSDRFCFHFSFIFLTIQFFLMKLLVKIYMKRYDRHRNTLNYTYLQLSPVLFSSKTQVPYFHTEQRLWPTQFWHVWFSEKKKKKKKKKKNASRPAPPTYGKL